MDVYCANCQEPWDSYHLMHDAIHECDLPERDIKAWRNKLAPKYRKAFAEAGYQFAGSTVCALLHCPCCPKDTPLRDNIRARQRAELLSVVADLMGDDVDGVASELDSLGRNLGLDE